MEKYYILVNGEQQGPFTQQEIINKGFSNDSYICNETSGGWEKISEVAGFSSFEKKNVRFRVKKGMKEGLWTGFLAFVIARTIHFGAWFILGNFFKGAFGNTKSARNIAEIIDSPFFGIPVLIFLTRYIYFKLIKEN